MELGIKQVKVSVLPRSRVVPQKCHPKSCRNRQEVPKTRNSPRKHCEQKMNSQFNAQNV